ncbi:hypothetical protein ACVW17_004387 [Bradyrhizobium sp. USDA 4473]
MPATRLVAVSNGGPPTLSGAGAAVVLLAMPSAPSAAVFELEIERLSPSAPCKVITPLLMVDGFLVPLIWSIFAISVCTLSVMLTWLPVAPEATKVIGVPFTVMVSPAAKPVDSESVPAAPESAVAPEIGAGGVLWLLTAAPETVATGLKKLLDAATAEAATSEVSLNVLIEEVSVDCKLAVVAVVSAPIRNEPVGGGFVVVAVSSIASVVPSGSVKLNVILSPSFGLTAPRSTEADFGAPVGCVTVAPVNDDCTDSSFSPNGEPSSATLVTVVVAGGDETLRRPIKLAP